MAEEKKKFQLTPLTKKILNIALDVVIGVVLLFALLLAICSIRSKVKGYDQYTEVFGKAYLAVASESMEGEKPDWATDDMPEGFKKGDLIVIKTVSVQEARTLKIGDIITFKTSEIATDKSGKEKIVLNSHRIKGISVGEEGNATSYITKGDNPKNITTEKVIVGDIVGVYQKKVGGIGKMFLFMNSSAGFFVCIVLPTLIIVAYCVVNLILVIRKEKKVQAVAEADSKAAELDAERERIRAEIMAEMQGAPAAADKPAESAPPAEEAQPEVKVEETEAPAEEVKPEATEAEATAEEVKPEAPAESKPKKPAAKKKAKPANAEEDKPAE